MPAMVWELSTQALGPFILGQSIGESISLIQQHGMQLRDNDMIFDSEDPLAQDICMYMKGAGVKLRFESRSQRLRLIDVSLPSIGELRYCEEPCSGSAAPPTFERLYKLLGPTYPAVAKGDTHLLQYPGMCFVFPAGAKASGDIAPTALASRLMLHFGADAMKPGAVPSDSAPIVATVGQGLTFSSGVSVSFESYAQDVLTDLGPPCRVFSKKAGMFISTAEKSGSALAQSASATYCPYFFNYFKLGLDVMFDGATHKVKKFILHTNHIERPDFNVYRKCHFLLSKGSHDERKNQLHEDSKWEQVTEYLGAPSRPMVRSVSKDNPLAPTRFFSFDSIIWEVMPCGYASTVTLFSTKSTKT